MTDFGDLTMYWGCAGGSSVKTLRTMNEPDVMMSYATKNNPWDGIDNLFIDSGGYSLMLNTGEHDPVDEYFEFVREWDASVAALQDYPCEPEILDEYDRTVRDHQERTVERAAENLAYIQDHGINAEPMAVLQGWETEDYLRCIDRFRDAGVLTDRIGIGSVCRRGAEEDIREVVTTVARELPSHDLHAFGVKQTVLEYGSVRDALDSVDSAAWYYGMYQGKPDAEPAWHTTTKKYLDYKRKMYRLFGLDTVARDGQETWDAYA